VYVVYVKRELDCGVVICKKEIEETILRAEVKGTLFVGVFFLTSFLARML